MIIFLPIYNKREAGKFKMNPNNPRSTPSNFPIHCSLCALLAILVISRCLARFWISSLEHILNRSKDKSLFLPLFYVQSPRRRLSIVRGILTSDMAAWNKVVKFTPNQSRKFLNLKVFLLPLLHPIVAIQSFFS